MTSAHVMSAMLLFTAICAGLSSLDHSPMGRLVTVWLSIATTVLAYCSTCTDGYWR